jgi:hypothetical protein
MGPGSHVGFPISAKNKNLVYDHAMNISAKFGSNLFCGFRKKDENFTFSSFFLKPQTDLNQAWQKCSLNGHIQNFFLALIGNPTWLPGPIMCSDWSKF